MKKKLLRIVRRIGMRRAIGMLMLAAFLALRLFDPTPLQDLRLRSFDFFQRLQPRDAKARPVVIVDIDEASLKEIGQWPWPRTLVADLVAKLGALGAVAIGFDVIFAEPDRMSPSVAVDSFRFIDDDTRAKLRAMPSNDRVLADAIRQTKVVLAQSGLLARTTIDPALPRTGFGMRGGDPASFLFTFDGLLTNIPELEMAAAGRGLITIAPERDGIARRIPLVMKAGDMVVPALTLDMLRAVTNAGAIIINRDAAGIRSVAVPGLEIPTDRFGRIWVNFAPHDAARYVSAKDVLAGTVPADRLRGRLVLIGTSAVGLLDVKTTPVDAVMPGVEVHAQILENALTGPALSHPAYASAVELAAALVIGLLIVILAPMVGALTLFGLGAGVAAGLIAASWLFYAHQALLLDLTFPLLSSFAIYVVVVFIGYFREQKDRRRIRSAFSQYLSPALVEQLAQSPKKLVLGGEERNMTIMFSDVRGFTSISEIYKHDPQGLTQLMNRFLTPLTNAIIEHKGTIDKYMGDAIMAFWNAPLDDPEHEIHACGAALRMLACVEELNRERAEEAQENGHAFIPIRMGIGINTGQCVVGNIGSDLRFDYSVLGDAVNLASRLEGRSKSYGTPIILGAATAARARDHFTTLEIDLITVKGKTEPERIFTLLGTSDLAARPAFGAFQAQHERMLAAYRARDWTGALEALEWCRKMPNDFGLEDVYALYATRIATFQQEPPPAEWNGVFAFDTK
jgi:adenylate cyclase